MTVDAIAAAVADGLLPVLDARLWAADGAAVSAALEHRRLNETHDCAMCGEPATCAFVVTPRSLGLPSWLDVCRGCANQLHDAAALP